MHASVSGTRTADHQMIRLYSRPDATEISGLTRREATTAPKRHGAKRGLTTIASGVFDNVASQTHRASDKTCDARAHS